MGEGDQAGPAPVFSRTTKGQCPVIEAGAMADARAAAVETHAGAENRVEESRAEPCIALGLVHAEVVLPRVRAQRHEPHGARAEMGDARQVDGAAALESEVDQGLGTQLLWHRCIEADAFAGSEPVG